MHRVFDTGYFSSCKPRAEETRDGIKLTLEVGVWVCAGGGAGAGCRRGRRCGGVACGCKAAQAVKDVGEASCSPWRWVGRAAGGLTTAPCSTSALLFISVALPAGCP